VISVDTSVVVRYLVGTPRDQAARAARLIDGDAEIAISLLVLAETAHVLRSFYRLPRADVVDALIELVTKANVAPLEISKPDVVDALVRARAFESSPVTDALIAATARAHTATPVYTFDEKFGRLGVSVAAP
jgi:predicted nucleic acid-binding protein